MHGSPDLQRQLMHVRNHLYKSDEHAMVQRACSVRLKQVLPLCLNISCHTNLQIMRMIVLDKGCGVTHARCQVGKLTTGLLQPVVDEPKRSWQIAPDVFGMTL